MHKISGVPRNYDWGSTTLLQNVLGREPDGQPIAELWFGAHPTDPSPLDPPTGDASSLEALIVEDPAKQLGGRVDRDFDHTLPFLMKLLAPARAVSLQVHPTVANAREGFAREIAAGVPLDAPNRSFKDANHKPEMVFAITDFDGLVGFRQRDETIVLLSGYPRLQSIARDLAEDPTPEGMQRCLRALVELPPSGVDDVVSHARTHESKAASGPFPGKSAHATVVELAGYYPRDAGVAASLMLNRVTLAPGECIFVPSGMPHAYIGGLAVEVMANSDNVFRAGLTTKYIDVENLMKNVAFQPYPVELLVGEDTAPGVRVMRPDAREFQLVVVSVDRHIDVPGRGPRIVLCTSGSVSIHADHDDRGVSLGPGEAVFVGHDDGGVRVEGSAQLVIAGVPA